MTDLPWKICDRKFFENEDVFMNYMTTLRKKNGKSIYNKYTINNINLDEFEKRLDNYVTTHNKKFDFYFIRCEFILQFDNNFTENIEYIYLYNADITNLKR